MSMEDQSTAFEDLLWERLNPKELMNETKPERILQITANVATILGALRGVAYLVVIVSLPLAVYKLAPLMERAVVMVEDLDSKLTPLMERAVAVLEDLDSKVDRAFDAAAPIGREAVTKGIETLKAVDAKTVGKELTEAVKRKLQGLKK